MKRKKNPKSLGWFFAIAIILLFFSATSGAWGFFSVVLIASIVFWLIFSSQSQESQHAKLSSKERAEGSRRKSKGTRRSLLEWAGKGAEIKAGNYRIRNPMTYFSDGEPPDGDGIVFSIGGDDVSYREVTVEASCIYQNLPVGTPVDQGKRGLDYWPRYANLAPNQRANYLDWLSSGRRGDISEIGYVFIYFYGLERRLLIDGKDWNFIIREVVELLRRYTSSGSFNGYLGSFLAYAVAKAGLDRFDKKWFRLIFEKTSVPETEQGLAVALAWMHLKGIPLPPYWAMIVARKDPRTSRSVVIDRVPEQFSGLFEKKYRARFGKGIDIRVSKREREIEYHPASPSLPRSSHGYDAKSPIAPVRIPNALGIQSQFKPLVEIWAECVEELKRLSQKVLKGTPVDSREAYEALPEALKAETEHPDRKRWEQIVSEETREDGVVIVEVSRLASAQEVDERARLTSKQSTGLAETANHIGYAIEPDARTTGRTYRWDDKISLFHSEEAQVSGESPYLAASIILELGISVAIADGQIDEGEIDHITHFLESQFMLDAVNLQRLEMFKHVLISQPPTMNGVGKRLQSVLTQRQLAKVAEFLVGVAAADGIIDKNEIRTLKKAYKALGVEVTRLDELLASVRLELAEPVEVTKAKRSAREGESIPQPVEVDEAAEIQLDEGRITEILANTREVAEILSEVLVKESGSRSDVDLEDMGETGSVTVETSGEKREFAGLDARYHTILEELIQHPEWSDADFAELARKHGIMPAGMMEAVNDWSVERLGDDLIEHDDKIYVNLNILGNGDDE